MSPAERVCWVLVVLGLGLVSGPFVPGDPLAPLGNGRFALAFAGLIMAPSAFICAFLFRGRNRVRRELLQGHNLLAHWTYPEAEWRAFAGSEHQRQGHARRTLLTVTAVVMVIVTAGYMVRDPRAGRFIGIVMAAVWVVCWLVSRVSLNAEASADASTAPEVRIGRNGLLLGREFHQWRGWGNSLRSCTLCAGPPACLEIVYLVPSGNAALLRPECVRIPVPAGREAEAGQLCQRLQH
jgi:hypothetical protein